MVFHWNTTNYIMATSSRQTTIFGTNDWKTIYKTFRQADFASYDFETLRKSFIDYLQTSYPETFNDYVESSEYVALLDIIAFMGQSLSYRNDVNTRENFIDTAERRDSVIKLANLIGYNPKRNTGASGNLKITRVRTTENVNDINGNNLNGVSVIWNDPANNLWQEQFNSIVNAALIDTQRFGRSGNTTNILGIKTDEYSIDIPTNTIPTIVFDSKVSGINTRFELVSASSLNNASLYEISPKPTNKFNILYRNDKLGYASTNTGFFVHFKQGTLRSQEFVIDQQLENYTIDFEFNGINNTDTWLFQIDPTTNVYSEWKLVEDIYSADISKTGRKIFSVKSRANDAVTYVFGDGIFSDMPVGKFVAYMRSSNGLNYKIDTNEITGLNIQMQYIGRTGSVETLSMALALTNQVNNAIQAETIANIKQKAPSRYYTQNRMVNGEDYNILPYAMFNSIIKSKSLNRSSIGVSRNLDLLDPTSKYSSTSSYATDGALTVDTTSNIAIDTFLESSTIFKFFTEDIRQILGSNQMVQHYFVNAPRYTVSVILGSDTNNNVYWNRSSVAKDSTTGYFYTVIGSDLNPYNSPLAVGTYTTNNLKYIANGSMILVTAPSGYYFDNTNKLISGIGAKTSYWVSIRQVIDDGYNNGVGQFSDGTGPITVSEYIPTGAILSTVIPPFDNSLSSSIIQECIKRIKLNRSFSLQYDNSININLERWKFSTSGYLTFTSLGDYRYSIESKAIRYYFGSVNELRFAPPTESLVYDRVSGKVLQDYITITKANYQPNSVVPMYTDTILSIVGQKIETDGYGNDYFVEVSPVSNTDGTIFTNPNFFVDICGNSTRNVFSRDITDSNNLIRKELVKNGEIIVLYGTKNAIEAMKYDYAPDTVFYAYLENKFYLSSSDTTASNVLVVTETLEYSREDGRENLTFNYKHFANSSMRINPSTSNIIDMYVVTNSYYTDYNNWIKDVTGKVTKPIPPTAIELAQNYSDLNKYKMLSDTIIFNSVKFKPLFGSKADTTLQGSINVTRNISSNASDGEIKTAVLSAINEYFHIDNWDFGDTFYFSELSAYLHKQLGDMISSVVIVPVDPNRVFGDLYEIKSAPYEIFTSGATANDILITQNLKFQ